MPAKSKAQFKKMFVLEKEGKISDATRREFTDTVAYNRLPAHVKNMHNARRPRRKDSK
jgi:hypothetical protein